MSWATAKKRREIRGGRDPRRFTVTVEDSYDWMDFHQAAARDKATSVGAWLAECGRERVRQQDRDDARWDRQEAKRKAAELKAASGEKS